jgi:peptidyl-prolyl cis-trans isomerase C
LAKKYSLCPSAKKGGDLGEFRRGDMVKAFENVVFKQEILTVHGPIKTQFGFHLIKTLYRG